MSVRKRYDPTFALFVDEPGSAPINGVHHLNPALTINGATVYPEFRYNGKDATTTTWKPWGYGGADGNLTIVGSGPDVSASFGSPALGPLDNSARTNRGKYFQAPSNTQFANVGTNDMVLELVFYWPGADAAYHNILSKGDAGAAYWTVFGETATNSVYLFIFGNATYAYASVAPAANSWNHVIWFVDRSGALVANVCSAYLNGVDGGVRVGTGTTNTSLNNTTKFSLLGGPTYTNRCAVAYAAMWQRANWLDTNLQASIALERFNRYSGIYPCVAKGTKTPTVQTRATNAYIDKIETDGTRKLYQVGSSWLRCASRNDAQGKNIKGYLGEIASTNYIQHSQNLGTWWSKLRSTTPSGSVLLPDGTYSTTATLHEDATAASSHYIGSPSIAVSNGAKYTFSAFIKAANRQYVYVSQDGTPGPNVACKYAVFGTGSVLQPDSAIKDSGIENWGNGWFRCWFSMVFTSGGASSLWRFYILSGSGLQTSFDGLDQDSLYITGIQLETGVDAPTSYIYASGSTATRNADTLYYVGNDGNLGGVGSEKKGRVTLSVLNTLLTSSVASSGSNYFTFNDTTINNHITTFNSVTHTNMPARLRIRVAGVDQVDAVGTGSINDNKLTKLRFDWKPNYARILVDEVYEAGAGNPDTNCLIPTGLSRIEIGSISGVQQSTVNSLISNFKIWRKPNNTR